MADVLKDGDSAPQEGPGEPLAIECLPTVMEEMHAEVAEAFYSAPRGGVEVGGVLYGVREKSRLLIMAARTLGCEHATGPSFVLSANDRARLEELLGAPQRDPNLAGMLVVGWYHSHTRSELDLTALDLEIHDRHFPEPWQVALVLRPAAMRPTRVCFYYREAGGGMSSSKLYRESAPVRPVEAPRAALRSAGSLPSRPAAAAAPAPVLEPVVEPPGFLAVQASPRPRWRVWALAATAVCLLAASLGYLTRERWIAPAPEPPSGLRLQVTDRQGQLEIRWDGATALLRNASGGSLELLDGSTRRFILLDPKMLRSGSVNFARQSDTVRIHLTVEKPDGSKVEELTSFLGQAPTVSPDAAQIEAQQQQAAEEAAAVERARLAAQKKTPLAPPAVKPVPPAVKPVPLTVKPEPAPSKPVQTAKVELPAPKPEPPAVKPAPPVVKPEPAPSKPVQTAKVEPPAPKPEPPAVKPAPVTKPPAAAPAPASLAGEWSLSRSVPSGSPFRPDSVTLSLTEDGGWVRGSLSGRYRAPRSSGVKSDVSFSFGGPMRSGNMKFSWAAADGAKGEIEFIRLPNNSESLEIVWYGGDRKFVFDDVVVRTKKR